MTLSSFTGLPEIADNSDATPGLWNARYSIVSQNLDQLNTDTSALSSRVSVFDSGISNRLTGWDRGSVSTTISVNTVNEYTSGAGVTVDSVLLQDGGMVLSGLTIVRSVDDSSLRLSGSDGGNVGGNILLYGDNHGTLANDIILRSDTNVKLQWDDSVGDWESSVTWNFANAISVDTIGEHGTGVGVTIDGVTCIDSAITVDAIEVSNATIYARTTFTPSVGTASGSTGAICWDSDYIYICVSTDSWSRATLNTF